MAFLNAEEETLLVKLYITKITQLCGLFRFPEEVEATAVTYLKRFYLKNTVMDWHPKNVMYAVIYIHCLGFQRIEIWQVDSVIPCHENNKQSDIIGNLHEPYSQDNDERCS